MKTAAPPLAGPHSTDDSRDLVLTGIDLHNSNGVTGTESDVGLLSGDQHRLASG